VITETPKPTIDSIKTPEFIALPNVETEISIAEILKEKRQNLKLSLSDVSAYLRVKEKDIISLENNEISRIAKYLYVPGLAHAYGKFLKIDEKIIEEKIKFLGIKQNTENKKHILINVGENTSLTPSKDMIFNFTMIFILLFLLMLSAYNSYEGSDNLTTNKNLISEFKNEF